MDLTRDYSSHYWPSTSADAVEKTANAKITMSKIFPQETSSLDDSHRLQVSVHEIISRDTAVGNPVENYAKDRGFEETSRVERQGRLQFLINHMLEQERKLSPETPVPEEDIGILAGELSKQVELERTKPGGRWLRLREINHTVGSFVELRGVTRASEMVYIDLNKLTSSMIAKMTIIRGLFAKHRPVKKMEYVMNQQLYNIYKDTKEKFERGGRSTQELLVFHGTEQCNVNE